MTLATSALEVLSPIDGAVVGTVPLASAADVERAVLSARRAADGWRDLGAQGRHEVLTQAVARALPRCGDLAALQAREMGQPVSVSGPLTTAAVQGLVAATEAALDYPFEQRLTDSTRVLRRPMGVGALITPWNFPLPVALGGLAALLAGGNTVIWKPSELCPLSALHLQAALDLPPGVLTVLTGDGGTGAALAAHDDVDITVFTGSVDAGRAVGAASGRLLRPAVMELGGKDPVIVDAGVDVEWAAATVAFGTFWNSGQVCTSMERIYVHESVAAPFLDALVARTESLRLGSPLDPSTQLGPLAGARQMTHVDRLLDDALAKGARLCTRGPGLPAGGGAWSAPTVLTDLDARMQLSDVEIFGPLAPVEVVADIDDAVRRARRGRFGLGATILSDDPTTVARAAELPAAVVWVNEWQGGAPGMVYAPVGDSGIGTVGTLDTVTRPMAVHVGASRAVSGLSATWGQDVPWLAS